MSDTGSYERHYAYPLVTWGSTFLGAVVALVTAFMLNILGAALGIAYAAFGQTTGAAATAGVIGVLWIAVANLVALGFGAWVAGRSTANPDHHGGTLQGIAVWAATSLVILLLAGSALTGTGANALQNSRELAQSDAPAGAPATSGTQTLTDRDTGAVQNAVVKTADAAASAAFGTFLAMVLGLVAAIFGARSGARHPNWTDRPRYTYVERRH